MSKSKQDLGEAITGTFFTALVLSFILAVLAVVCVSFLAFPVITTIMVVFLFLCFVLQDAAANEQFIWTRKEWFKKMRRKGLKNV